MASVEKFTEAAVVNQLRHIERTITNPSNFDIDPTKSKYNYSLAPDRGISAYSYFKERKSELYCYNRKDIKVMAGWIVTAPKTLPTTQYKDFFKITYDFLSTRYGEKNTVQAVVHQDEKGQPHLHYCFIPVTPDLKHNCEKICANDVLTKTELRNFHPALQKYLSDHGITAQIVSGVTRDNGGNRSVSELKSDATTRKWTREMPTRTWMR